MTGILGLLSKYLRARLGESSGDFGRFWAPPGASTVNRRRGETTATNSEQRNPGAGPEASDRAGKQLGPAARLVGVALREQNRAGIGVGPLRHGGAREVACRWRSDGGSSR
jgi:hypothetical protein